MTEQKLSRSLSPLSVWSLALGSIIGWGAFVMPGNLFLESAGPLGTAIGLGIGAVIMIIISLSYGYMIQRYPVAGGEFAYTYKSYVLHTYLHISLLNRLSNTVLATVVYRYIRLDYLISRFYSIFF